MIFVLAVLKLSGLVTSITGKMGGTVFQNGSGATIAKNNRYKRSRQNPQCYKRRALLAQIAQKARNLTDEQKTICAANGALFTRPTKAGPSTPYNWYAWYVSFGLNRVLLGGAPIATAVEPVSTPSWASFAIGDEEGTTNWLMTGVSSFDNAWTAVIEASQPVPDSAAFRPGQMKIIAFATGASADVTILMDDYVNVFGTIPSGRFVWFRVSWIYSATGQRSTAKITKADAQ